MRSHTVGFGGTTVKFDEPTGINWNDATSYELERVGVRKFLSYGGINCFRDKEYPNKHVI